MSCRRHASDLRQEVRAVIAEGRRETERLKAQGIPDEAIMRIWEKRAGLKWDEASQTHVPDRPEAGA
jgi:hypothetical protein